MENESVGEFFRQVRETKGLTVDEVASKTRIHPDFLKALEEGNFAKLPDQVFAKGFVRSYARSLGLDEEEAMRRFTESAGVFYEKQLELNRLRVRQAEDERRKLANRKVVLAAVGVALLGLVLLLSRTPSAVAPGRQAAEPVKPVPKAPLSSPEQPSSGKGGTQTAPTSGGEAPEPRPPQPAGSGQASGAVSDSQPPPSPPDQVRGPAPPRVEETGPVTSVMSDPLGGLPSERNQSGHAALTLDLEAMELSWVVVQVDGGSPHEALMRPGERIRWKAADRFTLTLGNAGGVRVELNGKPQGPFGPSGQVARDIVLKR
jgi:cytoskeletal protein RodZ